MAKKRSTKPNFSKMTTDALKSAYDPDWPFEMLNVWKVEMDQRDEPLAAHLCSFLDFSSDIGGTLEHPLFVGYCDPRRAAIVNWLVEQKQVEIERLILKKKWYQIVFMYEIMFLLDAFRKYLERFDDKSYWQILAAVWVHQEQLWRNRKLYLQLFQSPRPQRQFLMTAAERRKLDGMPDEFPVYRGFIGKRGMGLSWTTDRAKAEWFARRFAALTHLGQPRLMEGKAKKQDVLAYFNGRKEKEVVIDPAKIRSVKTHPVKPSSDDDGE